MACNWLPHNLKEVAAAITDCLDGKEPTLPGPDFPTGGIIINKNDIPNIMKTGHGSVKVRGKYKMEDNNIVFYELPYGVATEPLMDEIGAACEEGRINGIKNIRNESNRKKGFRLVIECEKNAPIATIINKLFKETSLQTSISYNQVALIDKTPTELNLKDCIKIYIKHNTDCIIREANFDKNKALARLEVVQGLLRALEDIDNIITLIKKSASAAAAKTALMTEYKFTEPQAKAIVDMKLGRLAGLEKIELQEEKAEIDELIKKIDNILSNPHDELRVRLTELAKKYGDDRRTELAQIADSTKEEKAIEFVEPEKCVVVLTEGGNIKRVPSASFRTQKRNGKGVKTQDDITSMVIRTNTIDSLMIFSNLGKMYRLLVDDIPVGNNTSKGVPVKSLIAMDTEEQPTVMYSIYRDTDAKYVFFVSKEGQIKKTSLDEYLKTKKKGGIIATGIRDGDSLASVFLTKDEDIVLLSKNGMGIKMSSNEVGASSRTSTGVKGMTLGEGDSIAVALPIHDTNDKLAIFTKNGLGKKIKLDDLPRQKRAGKGLVCVKGEEIAAAALVADEDSLLICGDKASICISAADIPSVSRGPASGNQILKGSGIKTVSKT